MRRRVKDRRLHGQGGNFFERGVVFWPSGDERLDLKRENGTRGSAKKNHGSYLIKPCKFSPFFLISAEFTPAYAVLRATVVIRNS